MPKKNANPIDRQSASRIRMQRMVCGLSQTKLGKAVGVSFQQVQKYEKGVNRVGASRLQQIANVLKVAPDFFFDGASGKGGLSLTYPRRLRSSKRFISSRDGVALSKLAFTKISDQKMRRSIVSLVEQIAQL